MDAFDRLERGRLELLTSVPLDHSLHHHHSLPAALADADPFVLAGFLAMLSYSLVASLHCAAMCGPLVCARLGAGSGWRKPGIWLYNAGRALSYPAVGALAGAVGGGIAAPLAVLGRVFAVAFAAILVGAALLVFTGRAGLLTQATARVSERLVGPALRRLAGRPSAQMLALGVLTATLPCMTLTPVLLLAAGSGSPAKGALLLGAFYLGTLPIMIVAPIVPGRIAAVLPPRIGRILAGVFLLLAGIITVLRGFS